MTVNRQEPAPTEVAAAITRYQANRDETWEDAMRDALAEFLRGREIAAEKVIEEIREVFTNEWVWGRVLPQYLGSTEVARSREVAAILARYDSQKEK